MQHTEPGSCVHTVYNYNVLCMRAGILWISLWHLLFDLWPAMSAIRQQSAALPLQPMPPTSASQHVRLHASHASQQRHSLNSFLPSLASASLSFCRRKPARQTHAPKHIRQSRACAVRIVVDFCFRLKLDGTHIQMCCT